MVVHPDGRQWELDNNNHVRAFSRPGMQAKFYPDGRLNAVQVIQPRVGNLTIVRGLSGGREAVGVRPGGVRVVTLGKGQGYVERPSPGRAGYVQRTYLEGGQPSAHVYRGYRFRGMVLYRYVPAYQYQPRFYAWATNPWPRQATYDWGGNAAPAFSANADYFAPAPAYPSATLWLTDFVLTENLKSAYVNHQEYQPTTAGAPPSAEPNSAASPISPEVKTALSQEVQQQVAGEQAASTQPGGQPPAGVNPPAPAALDPNQRTFVVSENLDVTPAGGPCTLTPGDIIYRSGDNLTGGGNVGVNVIASKAGDCPANSVVEIAANTLQEMQNQFREKIDAGLSTLAQNQGKDGLPSGPAADSRPSPEGTAQPDRDVVATLDQQQGDVDSAEQAATDGANGGAAM